MDSSNDIVVFSKGGNDEITFGLISSLYFSFIVSISLLYNHSFLYISGSTPITKK